MKLFSKLTVVAALGCSSALLAAAQTCSAPKLRKELRQLTVQEGYNLAAAFDRLKTLGWLDYFAQKWNGDLDSFDGKPEFLPYIRSFIRALEIQLQSLDPSITLPYFNWAQDAARPAESTIFNSFMWGSDGNPDNNHCVDDWLFSWTMMTPTPHCVQRQFSTSVTPWPQSSVDAMLRQEKAYDGINSALQGADRAVQLFMGGDMATRFRPNDPVLYFHLAMIDRIYTAWQNADSKTRTTAYAQGGNLSAYVPGFANEKYKIRDVLNLKKASMCYSYS
ncbi:Di-copper centre-containing protein [Ramicandelaber brevisporus]|nr:Di-copper centre-containing protein [Ramicandelaber brevisporus]